jgi:hypothetical protein
VPAEEKIFVAQTAVDLYESERSERKEGVTGGAVGKGPTEPSRSRRGPATNSSFCARFARRYELLALTADAAELDVRSEYVRNMCDLAGRRGVRGVSPRQPEILPDSPAGGPLKRRDPLPPQMSYRPSPH